MHFYPEEYKISLQYYVENTEFLPQIEIEAPFVYSSGRDAVLYDETHRNFWFLDFEKKREIFAELFTLQSLKEQRALQIIEKEFPEIYKAFLKIAEEVVI